VIAGLLALTLTAGIAVHDAATAAHNADAAACTAASAERQHAIALSRQLAAESLGIDPTDPVTAARLAVAAWAVFPTSQADSAITILLTEQQLRGKRPAGALIRFHYGPDGSVSWLDVRLAGKPPASAHDGTGWVVPPPLPANPYAALCADVGPPTRQEWNHYAVGESQPKICRGTPWTPAATTAQAGESSPSPGR
jgi:hypothetical protein